MQEILNKGINSNMTMPTQTIPESKKGEKFERRMVDFLYSQATQQRRRNSIFSDIRSMTQGDFVYRSVDITKSLNPDMLYDKALLSKDMAIASHLKHFDFLGIIANAIRGCFSETDSKYTAVSTDEYFTNDYIRERTQRLETYAAKLFENEINKMLLSKGINPNQTEFKSEQEQQQYQQQIDEEIKRYTPEEIEKDMSKNFKIKALEWSNNVLKSDKNKFNLEQQDGDRLIDYILTGRWFRHYKVGYDYYDIEDWAVEEVFFEETADIKYPQDAGYIGRLTEMSISQALSKFGHHLTTKQQEQIGDYFGSNDDYLSSNSGIKSSGIGQPFAENYIMPFHNYEDHNINLQIESALGAPMAFTARDDANGNPYLENHWMPRLGNPFSHTGSRLSHQLRNDINVTNATVEVMEAYWVSAVRFGVLIYENEVGQLSIENTTEDLLKDFIKEFDIKVKTNISLQGLQDALNSGRIEEYKNTITWNYKPQVRYIVTIKANTSSTIKEDIIIGGKPIMQQIKGDSNIYQVKIPIGGLITNSVIKKAFPYQQMHNICLNQMGELLADELGVFYTFDINSLASEYKAETTAETMDNMNDSIRRTRMLGIDPSRSNTQGSSVYPNIFQKNEIVFATQVQYRQQLGEYYRQQGYQQVGITPQMLGAPTTYETKEGVQQQAAASYALMSNIIDEFNTSKSKANEIHIAIAQQCEVNGKVANRMFKNSDGANSFIDILAEDPEYFSLRSINILPEGTSSDRAVVKGLQQMLMADNTIQKDFNDLADIFTTNSALKILHIAKEMRKNWDKKTSEQRAFESEQTDKQIAAQTEREIKFHKNELDKINLKGEWEYKQAYLDAVGRDSNSTTTDDFDQITKAFQNNLKSKAIDADIDFKNRDMARKETADKTSNSLDQQKIQLAYDQMGVKQQEIEAKKYIAVVNPG